MPTKTSKTKVVAKPKPAARRKLNLTRYIAATGDLAAAMKAYQTLLKGIDAGKKIDVQAFDQTLKAMNKAGDAFDKLCDKHEQAVLDYVDNLAAE
jgi:hypothetical protein